MNIETQILTTVLSSSGIVTFIGFVLKNKITAEIENSIRIKYDSKIELLKSELSISQSILNNSLVNQSEGIKATNEKRLECIDRYWESILCTEKIISSIKLMDTLITVKEFEEIKKGTKYSSDKFIESVENIFENIYRGKSLDLYLESSKKIENYRPYIGEELWILKYYFEQFIGRILTIYKSTYDKNINLIHWTKDVALQKSMKSVFTKNEYDYIYKCENDGINIAINIFKQKILLKIAEITSGNLVGKSSIENAILLSKEIAK